MNDVFLFSFPESCLSVLLLNSGSWDTNVTKQSSFLKASNQFIWKPKLFETWLKNYFLSLTSFSIEQLWNKIFMWQICWVLKHCFVMQLLRKLHRYVAGSSRSCRLCSKVVKLLPLSHSTQFRKHANHPEASRDFVCHGKSFN
jgi:hypothetical protein